MTPRLHHLLIFGGLVLGLAGGIIVMDTDPAFFGWIFGAGAGLAGGAFAAAITSGESLAGSGGGAQRKTRRANPALRHLEQPHGDSTRDRNN